ncbi:MAG: phage major capsid protein [Candidatus Magnetobacterium sp. LHC-1]
MITISTLSEALRTYYLRTMVDQLDYAVNPFYAQIEKNSEEVDRETIKMVMRYGRTGNVVFRAEDGALPSSGNRSYLQVDYSTKNIYGRFQLSSKSMKIAQKSKESFINILEEQLESTLQDAKDQLGRSLFGDGNGILAGCSAEGPTTTLTPDTDPGLKYLAAGMVIDICDNTGTVKVSGRTITAVDDVAGTITISGANVTTLATDIIVITGNYGLEMTGLAAVLGTSSNLYGKARASYPFLKPNITAISGEIDELDIQKGMDDAQKRAGGQTDFIICNEGVKRAYQYLMNALRMNIDIMDLKGGYKAMSYNGVPLTHDKYCDAGVMYLLNKGDWKMHQIGDWNWLQEDGAVLKHVSGYAEYEAVLEYYGDLGCKVPSRQTKLTGITEH